MGGVLPESRAGVVAGLTIVMLLSIFYGLSANQLLGNRILQSVLPTSATAGQSIPASTTTDVPNAVLQSISKDLSPVTDLNELVVLPAESGSGYFVSATVDLGYGTNLPANWRRTVQNDTLMYFKQLFDSGEDVQSGELYFMQDGQVVAGSGLGLQAYKHLSGAAMSGGGGFVSTLSQLPVVANEGPNDSWFQMENAGPT